MLQEQFQFESQQAHVSCRPLGPIWAGSEWGPSYQQLYRILEQDLEQHHLLQLQLLEVIEGFVGKEGQARRAVIATATGQDLRANTGRHSFQHNKYKKISTIVSNYRGQIV